MKADRSEYLLAHSELFRLMIDRSPLPVSIQDANWNFVFANQAYCDYVGYELSELVGRDPSTFLFPGEGLADSKSHRDWARSRSQDERFHPGNVRELIRRDGRRVRFHADMGHSQTDTGDDLWCGILFDLTELDKLQSDLSAFQDRADAMQIRFDGFAELSNEGMLVVDTRDDTILHANTVVNEITGVALTDEPQSFTALLKYVDPADLTRLRASILRGGSRRGIETNVSLQHPVSGKRSIRVRSFSGSRPEAETFVLMEDITDHIRYEEHRLSVEVMRRDAVVKEIHHRVNNQLHGVLNLLELALHSTDTVEEAVGSAISRISAIANLNGLLTANSSNVSVLHLVVQIANHAETVHGSHIRIEFSHKEPALEGISIDENAVAIALAINDLLMQACDLSSDKRVLVELEASNSTMSICIYCSDNSPNHALKERQQPGLGLVQSLLNGTDSTIELTGEKGSVCIKLTLGPETLGRAS